MQVRVLVACECSGRVRDAFAALGWEAWSADLLPSETPVRYTLFPDRHREAKDQHFKPAYHYRGDVRDLFNWNHPANENRAKLNHLFSLNLPAPPLWDLVIAHPPCDHLAYAGARWFKDKDSRRGGDGRMQAGAAFFMEMMGAPSPLVAVENPHSIIQEVKDGKATWAGPSTQVIQPWWFGDPFEKGIHLWLKGLPELEPGNAVVPYGRVATGGGSWRTDKASGRGAMNAYEDSEGRANRARVRSRTFPGLACAMASQWGDFAERYYREQGRG